MYLLQKETEFITAVFFSVCSEYAVTEVGHMDLTTCANVHCCDANNSLSTFPNHHTIKTGIHLPILKHQCLSVVSEHASV